MRSYLALLRPIILAAGINLNLASVSKPNFVVFLSDDQDVLLGGMRPMRKTKKWFKEQVSIHVWSVHACVSNLNCMFFASWMLCVGFDFRQRLHFFSVLLSEQSLPSHRQISSQHESVQQLPRRRMLLGDLERGRGEKRLQRLPRKYPLVDICVLVIVLSTRGHGYETYYIGKYMNQYGVEEGGITHVPPGWTHWNALKGNSR